MIDGESANLVQRGIEMANFRSSLSFSLALFWVEKTKDAVGTDVPRCIASTLTMSAQRVGPHPPTYPLPSLGFPSPGPSPSGNLQVYKGTKNFHFSQFSRVHNLKFGTWDGDGDG